MNVHISTNIYVRTLFLHILNVVYKHWKKSTSVPKNSYKYYTFHSTRPYQLSFLPS